MDRDRVVLADILRPRGNRGEVLARSQTDVPGRLEALVEANVRLANGQDAKVELTKAWPHKGDWVFKFRGVDSIEDAERFAGSELWIPLSERAKLPEGEYFQTDLIGCLVLDETGRTLGTVDGWQEYGGPPLMEVRSGPYPGRDVLIPFVKGIYREIDLEARRITVEVPDGLLDL
ncbi:MAG TPA: ribosome maturation factor RimM [Bryobacteraceae bacterium]|jgi:16S rRNA processing protein RimM|nr:ribosome maturation factor RimM [Bryobacteraceae bacterium]